MSKSFAEKLSELTPDASGLDRDAILIAAGRASARPNRRWQTLAGCLMLSQIITLFLLWPAPQIPLEKSTPALVVNSDPSPEVRPARKHHRVVEQMPTLLSKDEMIPPSRPLGLRPDSLDFFTN